MITGPFNWSFATRYPAAKEIRDITITPRTKTMSFWYVLTNSVIFDRIVYMSTTKSAGSTRLGRDSQPQYLGIKLYAGEKAKAGQILVRQRGTKLIAGKNVGVGKDDTLFALKAGVVGFSTKRKLGFDRSQRIAKVVNVT